MYLSLIGIFLLTVYSFFRPDRITEDTRMVEGTVGDYYSILFVKDTNELDSGKFSCKVCYV